MKGELEHRVLKGVIGMAVKIRAHWAKLKEDQEKGRRSAFRDLREKTGLKFASGSRRKLQRAAAKRALKLAKDGAQ